MGGHYSWDLDVEEEPAGSGSLGWAGGGNDFSQIITVILWRITELGFFEKEQVGHWIWFSVGQAEKVRKWNWRDEQGPHHAEICRILNFIWRAIASHWRIQTGRENHQISIFKILLSAELGERGTEGKRRGGTWLDGDEASEKPLAVVPVSDDLHCCCCWLVAQLCPNLCDPMDCSPPGSSVHGISQARVLEWVAISFSWGSSWPSDRAHISCLAGRFFTTEPPGKPKEANSGSWLQSVSSHCWLCFKLCGEPSQPLGSQKVRHDWATERNTALCSAYMRTVASPVNHGTSLVAQMVKRLPTMQKTWV